MTDPRDADGPWLRMPGVHRGTCGFVRRMESGAIEIEHYDHSEAAESAFGDEVSTIYRIAQEHLPALALRLASGFGGPVPAVVDLPGRLARFAVVESLIDWLVADSGIAVTKRVDFDV